MPENETFRTRSKGFMEQLSGLHVLFGNPIVTTVELRDELKLRQLAAGQLHDRRASFV